MEKKKKVVEIHKLFLWVVHFGSSWHDLIYIGGGGGTNLKMDKKEPRLVLFYFIN